MPARKKTPQEKKTLGTFNVTRDSIEDFNIIDGLVKFVPSPPKDYNKEQADLWNRVWRHLTKHGYGKEVDFELVNALVFEWSNYIKYREYEHTTVLAVKALANYKMMSDMLCINPNALGKAAILTKGNKKESTLIDAIRAAK